MQSRDETGDRDVEKSRGREGERVREEPERMAQAVVRRDRPDHRGDAGGEIEQQRARAREPRVHQDGEIPDAVRDLVRGHCESGHQAEGEAAEEGRGDQHSVERVVEAVPHQYQDARGLLAQVLVPVRRVMVPIAVVAVVVFARVLILRVSVPPEHQLLDDEKDPEPQHQREPDVVGARAYMAGKASHITGVVASGDTLTIRLLAPAPDFLSRLARPTFCVARTSPVQDAVVDRL